MDNGLSLEVIWLDNDAVEVRVRVSNGRVAAVADCYGGHETFAEVADRLRGFPVQGEERREVLLGTFDPGFAGGGAKIVFRRMDSAGHLESRVIVRAPTGPNPDEIETASFSFPVEAAAIDDFVAALGRTPLVVGAAVALRQAI